MNIRQISSGDELTQGFIGTSNTETENGRGLMRYAKLIMYMRFYRMVGNADTPRAAASATGGVFRALNADYTAAATDAQYGNVQLRILGDRVRIDRAHERRGWDIASVKFNELMNFAEDLGKNLQFYFFNGTGASNQFVGLKKIFDDAIAAATPTAFQTKLREQIVTPGNAQLVCVLGSSDAAKKSQQRFLTLLDQAINKVGASSVIVADDDTVSYLQAVGKEYCQYSRIDEFGEPIMTYRGRPVVMGGYNAAGSSKTIPHNETFGTTTTPPSDNTRIYVVRFGSERDVTLATNVGVDVKDEGLVGNFYQYQVDMDLDLAVLDPRAVSIVRGIKIDLVS